MFGNALPTPAVPADALSGNTDSGNTNSLYTWQNHSRSMHPRPAHHRLASAIHGPELIAVDPVVCFEKQRAVNIIEKIWI